MTEAGDRLAASVQTRLVRHARAIGADPNGILVRYATERLLYRLSRSEHASRFILKGGPLLCSDHELDTVVGELAEFLLPPLGAAAAETDFETSWLPGGPWRPF